eukprot:6214710-Pleurochrysis_carterae.AAC.1
MSVCVRRRASSRACVRACSWVTAPCHRRCRWRAARCARRRGVASAAALSSTPAQARRDALSRPITHARSRGP